jgi:hypothetical protein
MASEEGKSARKGSHKLLKAVLIVVGLLVVLGVIGNLASPSSKSDTSGGSSASASQGSSSSEGAKPPSTPGLNQPADDGKFRFVATTFTCGQTYLVNDNEFENATAQGQWCLLSLSYSNIGTEAQTFETSSQYVYDASGKQYSADTNGTIAANPSSSQCVTYQQINPGVSSSCAVAFDIPKGVVATYAMLHDSSVSDGVKVALQ